MFIDKIIDYMVPDFSASPAAQRLYRIRIAAVACASFAITNFVVLPAMFLGLPMLGQLAWANDQNTKVAQALVPLEKRFTALEGKVDSLDSVVRQQWAFSLATQIKEARAVWCTAPAGSNTRTCAQDDIDRLQSEYQSLKGDRYPVAPCSELTQ